MPALQVRDFPEELYEELRAYAEENHRSIAQQTIACVENELRRNREAAQVRKQATWGTGGVHGARGADGGCDADGIYIPASVREAAMRARNVEAFGWMRAFQIDSREEREMRREKWEMLRKRFADLDERWNGPVPTCEEIAQMIREDREDRANRIIENVAAFEASAKEG